MHNTIINIPKIQHLDSGNFFLICGPCAIEGRDMAMSIAEKVKRITDDLKIPYVFKGSYRKANRSSIDSFTGIGDEKALKILKEVGETFDLPTTRYPYRRRSNNSCGVCRCSADSSISVSSN